jgi:hypothetical protein
MPTETVATVTTLARRAVRYELGMWRSSARWLLRRPDVAPGETAFAYRGPVLGLLWMFFVLSAVEVVAVDLILPWGGAVRIMLLALGVWGTMFMLGMLASLTVYPHVVRPSGLRIRYGVSLDVQLPWDAVGEVRAVRRSNAGKGTVQLDGDALHVVIGGQTTVRVELTRPVRVTLAGPRTAEVTSVDLHADDAAGLVAAVRAARATGR